MAHSSEDCASVLDQFVQDVANLPAEMNHLMEEIQAKDKTFQDCRTTISSLDNSLQKFIKLNGSLTPNAKEDQYSKTIMQNLQTCRQVQDEKIGLSEKACILLDRQIKKLDVKIRGLQKDGVFPQDPSIPSLFNTKDQHRDPPKTTFPERNNVSSAADTASPLNPTSGNANIAVSQRLNQALSRSSNPAAAAAATAVSNQTATSRNSAPATPASAAAHLQQRQRESSAGAVDTKRRRMNGPSGTLPITSSNLRQASTGPGTPKAGTPTSSRAGSAGPRGGTTGVQKKAVTKKVAPHHQVKKVKSSTHGHGHGHGRPAKRSTSASGRVKASTSSSSATGTGTGVGIKKSPSAGGDEEDDDDDESLLSSADISESEDAMMMKAADEVNGEEDEGNEDSKVYCTCRTVSHGDMVACDNINCPYEWFHWKCVGLTREPVGTWYCDECRKTLGK